MGSLVLMLSLCRSILLHRAITSFMVAVSIRYSVTGAPLCYDVLCCAVLFRLLLLRCVCCIPISLGCALTSTCRTVDAVLYSQHDVPTAGRGGAGGCTMIDLRT